MPSKSVSLEDEVYMHIVETTDEDQTFSGRLNELAELGIEAEDDEAAHTCRHCGRSFGNPGAKSTHEKDCPERQE